MDKPLNISRKPKPIEVRAKFESNSKKTHSYTSRLKYFVAERP